ncbi:MAG: DUF4393 domain-containing protein [Pseudomonadota bacterium]
MSMKPSARGLREKQRIRPFSNRSTAARREPSSSPPLPTALSDLSSKIWGLSDVKAYMVETVEEVLRDRGVSKNQICSPNLEITIPAIEAMRYSPLRREIASLIASTMDRENAAIAHPSFLNILQQLTEDEVKMLASFPSTGRVLPMAHLWMTVSRDHSEILHRNIVPSSIARLCETKSRIPLYIDNLTRLQLLHEPDGLKIGDSRVYSNLLRQGFCGRILERPQVRKNSSLEKHTIALSDVGEAFRKVCLT